MSHLEDWFRSWVPDSVFSEGGGRGSVEAWYATSGIELPWFACMVSSCFILSRFKLAAGLGEPWTRDGGIPQGCPLSMMFAVALYLPWCRYLSVQEGVEPQLYVDYLKCASGDPALLLRAARF